MEKHANLRGGSGRKRERLQRNGHRANLLMGKTCGVAALPDLGRFVPRFSWPRVKLLGARLNAKAATLEGGAMHRGGSIFNTGSACRGALPASRGVHGRHHPPVTDSSSIFSQPSQRDLLAHLMKTSPLQRGRTDLMSPNRFPK